MVSMSISSSPGLQAYRDQASTSTMTRGLFKLEGFLLGPAASGLVKAVGYQGREALAVGKQLRLGDAALLELLQLEGKCAMVVMFGLNLLHNLVTLSVEFVQTIAKC